MQEAKEVYAEYNLYIRALRSARNQYVRDVLKHKVITAKNKVGTFAKAKVTKFKESIKDVDLRVKHTAVVAKEKIVEAEIKVVETVNRFKKNVVIKVNSAKKKIGRFKKTQIRKFKKRVKNAEKRIKSTKVKIVRKANRFKKNVTRKVKSTKKKIGRFKKEQIKKFKKNIKDIDLSVKKGMLSAKEMVINGQIKIIEKTSRFKKNVSAKVNSAKDKVGRFSKQQIKKVKKVFVSSNSIRVQKQHEIDVRLQKIAELKSYRSQLINSSYQHTASGRSRGVFYIWMFAIIGLISMFTLMLIKYLK